MNRTLLLLLSPLAVIISFGTTGIVSVVVVIVVVVVRFSLSFRLYFGFNFCFRLGCRVRRTGITDGMKVDFRI